MTVATCACGRAWVVYYWDFHSLDNSGLEGNHGSQCAQTRRWSGGEGLDKACVSTCSPGSQRTIGINLQSLCIDKDTPTHRGG